MFRSYYISARAILGRKVPVRQSSSSSTSRVEGIKSKKVGLVGMGHVGNAVFHNLRRCGFRVVSVSDVDAAKCAPYGDDGGETVVRRTNREVAEDADIVVTSESFSAVKERVFVVAVAVAGVVVVAKSLTGHRSKQRNSDIGQICGFCLLSTSVGHTGESRCPNGKR